MPAIAPDADISVARHNRMVWSHGDWVENCPLARHGRPRDPALARLLPAADAPVQRPQPREALLPN